MTRSRDPAHRAPPRKPPQVSHRRILHIAVPMTLAYISTPLLGLVDTAVIGQLGRADYIGGVAVGALLFDIIFSSCNFLRSGTTGLTAQALGGGQETQTRHLFWRAMLLAMAISAIVLTLQGPLIGTGRWFMATSADVDAAVTGYTDVRIWSTPFALTNFVVLGWLLGMGRARLGLVLQLLVNGLNMALDAYFVLVLDLGVEGIAFGTLLAELSGTIAGLVVLWRLMGQRFWPPLSVFADITSLKAMIAVNRDIMIRSFSLLFAFFLLMREGAALGDITLAANAVLMNFFMISGYFLDGFAVAAEQMAGQAIGARHPGGFVRTVHITRAWSLGLGGLLSALFLLSGAFLIDMITTNQAVRIMAQTHLPWAALTAICGALAFQLDGVFIGATWSRDMRNAMLLAAGGFALALYALKPLLGNHGLWLALLLFLFLRGGLLHWRYRHRIARGVLDGRV